MAIKKITLCLCFLALSFVFQTELFAVSSVKLKAKSAILVNAATGKILYAKNVDKPMQPASLTKILTLYLVHEAINEGKIYPSDGVKISTDAYFTSGSSMYLEDGAEVELEELIKGVAVASANDASVAIAEYLGGDVGSFVKKMNAKAHKLGMSRSYFKNPNGLPAKGQVSTARDIAKLARAYIRDFPESLNLHAMQSFTYRNITQTNHNVLLKHYPDVDGLKTGFVRAAGFHLIVTARRDGTRLIAVVMGETNPVIRAQEAAKLLDIGFRMTKAGERASRTSYISVREVDCPYE
ncbi:MAG: D-alanyl-D-alanine carboxypeptidase [Deltaproteobacteria bacterium]|nr:D-alanyl-D-alanine carboxypeptidase [Deltaproteobacteria bacterium]